MQLWKRFNELGVTKILRIGKGATIVVTSDAGVETSLSTTEIAVVGGLTADSAEINRATDISARIVTTTATTVALTVTQHADRVVLVNTTGTVGNTLTLPVATGSGAKFTVINNVAHTQGSIVILSNGTLDVMKGVAVVSNTSTTNNVQSFLTTATDDRVTWNRTTTGGGGTGDYFEAWDGAANTWTVQVRAGSIGNAATPFSAS